jgi:hypothetical protein
LRIRLDTTCDLPILPDLEPSFKKGDLLRYYISGSEVTVHFPRFGQIKLDLSKGETRGKLLSGAVQNTNILEDMVAVGISPHLRRRGMFLIHGFAAAHEGRGVILVGPVASGKTTTGMALLNAGWKLLSNDSPVIHDDGRILSYPGMLTAHRDSFARFEAINRVIGKQTESPTGKKLAVPAEQVWPSVWADEALPAAIFFPNIESRKKTSLSPIKPVESLRRLLPQAVEQWDQEMIPFHLKVLSRLVENTSSFCLHLGTEIEEVPSLLENVLD